MNQESPVSHRKAILIVAHTLLGLVFLSSASKITARDLISLATPGDREFVRDMAGMLNESEKKQIVQLCDQLLTETATPIIVVTIESMAQHGGTGMRIETFATVLFNQWEIGIKEINGKPWDTGILLLVSKNDRKARIELGKGWGREKDQLCRKIMDENIIYFFKKGDFGTGITKGAEALDQMARGFSLPSPPKPWWYYPAIVLLAALLIGSAINLYLSGAKGWAWLLWASLFTLVGIILYQLLANSGRNGSGGGFDGGSFGGGSSGGGGATGSW